MVKTYEVERDLQMAPGDSVQIKGYTFTFKGTRDIVGPNYSGVRAEVAAAQNGAEVAVLFPEKRVYRVQTNPMTEAAIDSGVTRDLYVSLGEPADAGAWIIRIYVKPFIDWIWGGCLAMALGGVIAASDRRYRMKQRQTEPSVVLVAGQPA
jgi:cytochrome c-type biogenesis protein CcmF